MDLLLSLADCLCWITTVSTVVCGTALLLAIQVGALGGF